MKFFSLGMALNLFIFDIRCFPNNDDLTEESELLKSCLDKSRILKFHSRDDRCRALAGELLIRKVCPSGLRELRRKDDGGSAIKPCHPDVLFNVSHDEDFVILAQSPNHAVGVDIMKIKKSNPKVSVAEMLENLRDIFSMREWSYMQSHPEDSLRRFYRVWTAKEAYVKALGTGLYTEPRSVCVEGLEREESHVFVHHEGSESFRTAIFDSLIQNYIVSICVGPLEKCDKSWTQFVRKNSESIDSLPPVTISSLVILKLEDLVSC